MGKIIEFSKDYKKSIYSDIIKELKQNKSKEYSLQDATNYANRILEASRQFNPYRCHTLIVKIAHQFGIATYIEKLHKGELGAIRINEDTKQIYAGNNEGILLQKDMDGYMLRFVVAYALGCYLFNYLGSDKWSNKEYIDLRFTSKNIKENKIAYRFAMEILMPTKLFIEQHNIAFNEFNRMRYAVLRYLSLYFKVTMDIVERRICEIKYSQ